MGAAAISTNAGSTLILADTGIPFLHAMRPFIDGITLIVWAWATWWIPLLLLFGIWKHGGLSHAADLHAGVLEPRIPLGMYGLASMRLSLATDFPPLRAISRSHDVDRACGLGRHSGRTRHRVLAQLSGVRAVEATAGGCPLRIVRFNVSNALSYAPAR